jgi:hypothetical protein
MAQAGCKISSLVWLGGFNDIAYGLRNNIDFLANNKRIVSHASQHLYNSTENSLKIDLANIPPQVPSVPPQFIVTILLDLIQQFSDLCLFYGVNPYFFIQPSLTTIDDIAENQHSSFMKYLSPQYLNNFDKYIQETYEILYEANRPSNLHIIRFNKASYFRDVVHLSTVGDKEIAHQMSDSIIEWQ